MIDLLKSFARRPVDGICGLVTPAVGWALFALAVGGVHAASPPTLTLRLDEQLVSPQVSVAHTETQLLTEFGKSDIRRRIQLYHDRSQAIHHESSRIGEQIEQYEGLILRLRSLNQVQDRTIEAMQQMIGAHATEAPPSEAVTTLSAPPPQPLPRASVAANKPVSQRNADPRPSLTRPKATASGSYQFAGIEIDRVLLQVVLLALGVSAMVAGALVWVRRRRERPLSLAVAGLPLGATEEVHVDEAIAAARESTSRATESGAPPPPVASPSVTPSPPQAPGSGVLGVGDAGGDTDVELDRALASIQESDVGGDTDVESGIATDVETMPPAVTTSTGGTWDLTKLAGADTDRDTLKEVDTLIAFEHYDKAKEMLDTLLAKDAQNPEYLLRHYHVRTHGGVDTHDGDEEMLRLMMDGPLSDTMLRVREIGRSLMPGDPLFKDEGAREAARELFAHDAPEAPAGDVDEIDPDTLDTVVMKPHDPSVKPST